MSDPQQPHGLHPSALCSTLSLTLWRALTKPSRPTANGASSVTSPRGSLLLLRVPSPASCTRGQACLQQRPYKNTMEANSQRLAVPPSRLTLARALSLWLGPWGHPSRMTLFTRDSISAAPKETDSGNILSLNWQNCFINFFFLFFSWPCQVACGLLVPRPRIEPGPQG